MIKFSPMIDTIITAVRIPLAIIGTLIFVLVHATLFTLETAFLILVLPFLIFQSRIELKKTWPMTTYPKIARFGLEKGTWKYIPAIATLKRGVIGIWKWVFDD